MDPSKFPTDNLYKFIALCGMVLALASGYAFWTVSEKRSFYAVEEAYYRSTLSALAGDYEKEKSPALKEAMGKVLVDTAAVYTERRHKDEVNREKLLSAVSRLTWLLCCSTFLGICLAGAGFVLWYHKLQRHLDRAVIEASRRTA
jgi:hypothetical protein